MPILFLAVIVILVDQCSKFYIQAHMFQGMSIPVVQDVMHITYILNPGAAFGLFEHKLIFLIGIAILLVVGVVYFYQRLPKNIWLHIGLGLLVGGAIGNVIDRVRLGYVVDFFDFRIWPIFNMADIAIVSGVACILLIIVSEQKEDDRIDK